MAATLAIYTVNCAGGKRILIAGMGAKHFDVIACQEIDKDCSEAGYDRIAQGVDAEHDLNVSIFLDMGKSDPNAKANTRARHAWHQIEGKGLHLLGSRTGRALAVAAMTHQSNRNYEVWVASMHCKSGEQFTKAAQKEVNEALDYLLELGRSAAPKAIVLTGDMNWARVGDWADKNEDTLTKFYRGKTYYGKDQLSGRSLMQTMVMYSEKDGVSIIDMADGGRTVEGHATLHTELAFADPSGSGKRQKKT